MEISVTIITLFYRNSLGNHLVLNFAKMLNLICVPKGRQRIFIEGIELL